MALARSQMVAQECLENILSYSGIDDCARFARANHASSKIALRLVWGAPGVRDMWKHLLAALPNDVKWNDVRSIFVLVSPFVRSTSVSLEDR